MEMLTQHPWREAINQRLSPEYEKNPIAADNSDWEYIEGEAAKIGTNGHDTVNIEQLQNTILQLLSTETKDFRLLAHLLNTLQRHGKPENILLAIVLLTEYLSLYWQIAAPQKLKKRIIQLIIQRFNLAKNDFNNNATEEEREASTTYFIQLKQQLEEYYPELCDDIDMLIVSFAKKPANASTLVNKNEAESSTPKSVVPETKSETESPSIIIDSSSSQNWRKTLLKIVEYENKKAFDQPIVFQLRRHIVWLDLTIPPATDCVTNVPALPIEKTNEYRRELNRPTLELWQKIETTITYSPYWFDGHYMSAYIARKLGYVLLAELIKNELNYFLDRFPECRDYKYSNNTPFADEETLKWLKKEMPTVSLTADNNKALNVLNDEGLPSAFQYLEKNTSNEKRSLFYSQLQAVALLNLTGCHKLASQQLNMLYDGAKDLSVQEWEPSFFEHCKEIQEKITNKE
ncbi:type VI secretion system protein TssA [Frischella perrara]|uniref:type VI secretion system protein TssA n=1 Tax=Frischella perrara TaxID=1267021 RepID=UPI0023F1FA2C|nr:type VI secretion system protein TssA [Frischella perrara]MCT6875430.1 type VI secretion system protein TssA [Frischella perrara]